MLTIGVCYAYVSQRWGSLEMYSSTDTKDRPGGRGGGEGETICLGPN